MKNNSEKNLDPKRAILWKRGSRNNKIHCRSYTAVLFHLLLPSCCLCQPCSSPLCPLRPSYLSTKKEGCRTCSVTSTHRPIITGHYKLLYAILWYSRILPAWCTERFEIRTLEASENAVTSHGLETKWNCWIAQWRYAFLSARRISCGQDVCEWGFIICMG